MRLILSTNDYQCTCIKTMSIYQQYKHCLFTATSVCFDLFIIYFRTIMVFQWFSLLAFRAIEDKLVLLHSSRWIGAFGYMYMLLLVKQEIQATSLGTRIDELQTCSYFQPWNVVGHVPMLSHNHSEINPVLPFRRKELYHFTFNTLLELVVESSLLNKTH